VTGHDHKGRKLHGKPQRYRTQNWSPFLCRPISMRQHEHLLLCTWVYSRTRSLELAPGGDGQRVRRCAAGDRTGEGSVGSAPGAAEWVPIKYL